MTSAKKFMPNAVRIRGQRTSMADVQAVVLCGGLGTRLRSEVPEVPKALAPVAGRPFLDYLLAGIVAAGMRKVVLCTGVGSNAIEEEYGLTGHCDLEVIYSREHLPLGTGGALKFAQSKIQSNTFFLMNGDSLLDINYDYLLSAHLAAGALATVALKEMATPGRYGMAVLEPNGEISGFAQSAAEGANGARCWINAGVYALDRRVLQEIPAAPPAISFERTILPSLTGRGPFGHKCSGFFLDIGVPEDYRRAQTEIPGRSRGAASHSR